MQLIASLFKFYWMAHISMNTTVTKRKLTTAVLVVTLGTILLFSTMTNHASYADEGSVKVFAKEKQGMILLLVKNANVNIRQLKITLLDGTIDEAKRQGWTVSTNSPHQVTLTANSAIPPNGKEIFFIKTKDINSIIVWAAKNSAGSVVGVDNARAIIRQKFDTQTGSDNTYMANASIVSITTDKVFYKNGEKILISGILEPNSKITITIYTPSGQKVKMGEQTDPMGKFKVLHVLHDAEFGTYKLQASEPYAFAETTFKVT